MRKFKARLQDDNDSYSSEKPAFSYWIHVTGGRPRRIGTDYFYFVFSSKQIHYSRQILSCLNECSTSMVWLWQSSEKTWMWNVKGCWLSFRITSREGWVMRRFVYVSSVPSNQAVPPHSRKIAPSTKWISAQNDLCGGWMIHPSQRSMS